MSDLIAELKNEHKILVSRLTDIRKQFGSRKAAETLVLVKKALLAHLKKEDKKLYPILNEAAKSDARLARIVETFAKDMEGISGAALAFFDKWTEETVVSHVEQFKKDFDGLCDVLAQRISSEELVLYAEYTKLEAKWNVALKGESGLLPKSEEVVVAKKKASAGEYALAGMVVFSVAAVSLVFFFLSQR